MTRSRSEDCPQPFRSSHGPSVASMTAMHLRQVRPLVESTVESRLDPRGRVRLLPPSAARPEPATTYRSSSDPISLAAKPSRRASKALSYFSIRVASSFELSNGFRLPTTMTSLPSIA